MSSPLQNVLAEGQVSLTQGDRETHLYGPYWDLPPEKIMERETWHLFRAGTANSTRDQIRRFLNSDASMTRDVLADIEWDSSRAQAEFHFCSLVHQMAHEAGNRAAHSWESLGCHSPLTLLGSSELITMNLVRYQVNRNHSDYAEIMRKFWTDALTAFKGLRDKFHQIDCINAIDIMQGNLLHLMFVQRRANQHTDFRLATRTLVNLVAGNFANQGRGEEDFRELLELNYPHEKFCPMSGCPIFRRDKPQDTNSVVYSSVAAHIVDCAFGSENFQRFFGDQLHLMHPSNGWLLFGLAEKLFDRGSIFVLPIGETADQVDLRIFVTGDSNLTPGHECFIKNRSMVFANETERRPCGALVYFHALKMIGRSLTLSHCQGARWTEDLLDLLQWSKVDEKIYVKCPPEVAKGPLGLLSRVLIPNAVLVHDERAFDGEWITKIPVRTTAERQDSIAAAIAAGEAKKDERKKRREESNGQNDGD